MFMVCSTLSAFDSLYSIPPSADFLWDRMWLYYAFSAAVVLFLDVLASPLSSTAMLNLALISDLETLCTGLAPFSPGAKRVMEVSREMSKYGFEVIKMRAKRKAREEMDGDLVNAGGVEGQRRAKKLKEAGSDGVDEIGVTDLGAGPSDWENGLAWNDFPGNFSWDDWDQWLNDISL